ncbi:MAG: PKD domain-containing protein [Bacteroidota bacterium]
MINVAAPATISNAGPDQSHCNLTTATLAGNVPVVGTGVWTVFAGTATITTPSSPTSGVTGLVPGNVTLRWTISNPACGASTDDVVITIVPQPVADANIDQSVCSNNANVTLAGSVTFATGGVWSTLGSGTFDDATLLNAIYTPSNADTTAGTVTLRLTTTGNGICPADTDDMIVTISDAPTANANVNQTVCANNAVVTLNGSVTIATGGIWTTSGSGTFNPNNTTLGATYTPSAADTAAGSVTLRLTTTGNGGCAAAFDEMIITITDAPRVSAGPDKTVCSAAPDVLLNGIVTIATGGIWTSPNGTGTFNPNNTTLNATYLASDADTAAGSVTLILTSTGHAPCSVVADTMTLTITAGSLVNAGADQTICANNPNATIVGSVPSTGIWSTPDGTGTFSPNATTMTAVYQATPADTLAGLVTIVLTPTGGGACPGATDTMIITITPGIYVNAGPNQTVCASTATVNLNGAVTTATGGTWTTSGTGTFNNATLLNAIYTPSATDKTSGPITLTLTSTGNGTCGAVTDVMLINFTPVPTTANAGPDQNICNVTTATLAGNAPTTGTGVWSVIVPPATITTPASPTSGVTGLTIGSSVTLRWTISNGVCAASTDDVVINIALPPTAANAGPDQNICNATTATLAGNAPATGTGLWTVSSGTATITTPASPTSGLTGLVPGTNVTLTWTTTNGACSSTDNVTIFNALPPSVADAGADQNLCNVTSASLSGNTPTIGTGTWSVIVGPATITSPNSPSSTVTGLTIGSSVTLRWTISSGVCVVSEDDVVINIAPPPTAADADADQTLCNVTNTVLSGNAPVVGTGLWTVVSGTATITTPTDPLSTVTGMVVGTSVTLRWTTTNGACTNSDDVVITILNPPTVAAAGPDQGLCNVTTTTLAGNIPTVGTGLWTVFAGTATITTPSSPTSGVTGLTIGASVTLVWTISNPPCTPSTDTVIIDVADLATIANAGADQHLCNVTTTTLNGNVATVGTGAWTVVSGTATITTPSLRNSGVTGLVPGSSATLRWTIFNPACGSSFDDVVINVDELPTVANAGPDQALCNVTSSTLTGNAPAVGTGVWTVETGTATITTPSSPTSAVTGLVVGSVTLVWTISNDSCPASTDTMIINVAAPATVADADADQNLCNITTATLSGNTATVGSGLWTVVAGVATITTPASPTSGVTGLVVGASVTLRWTITNGGCGSNSDDMVINVSAPPTVANADVDQDLCNVTSTTLNANVPAVGTGLWTVVSGTATITTPSSPTSTVNGLVVGASVTLVWTISNSPCTASTDTMVIDVAAPATIANAGPDQNICNVTSTTLAGNVPVVGTGVWTVFAGTATITTPSSPTSTVTGLTIGSSVTLRWTISNPACGASIDDVIITIAEPPTAANANVNQSLCNVTNTVLAGNTPTVGTGLWTVVSGTATITTPASPTSTVTGLVVGTSVTLRWTTTNLSCTSSDDMVITIMEPPTVANAGPDQNLCSSGSTTLSANVPAFGTGLWTVVSGTATITTPSSPTSGVTGLTAGTSVTLVWTISNAPCTASTDTVIINISGVITVANAGPDQHLCNVTAATLAGNVAVSGTGAWSVVSGTATITTPASPTSGVTGLVIGASVTLRWTISAPGCASSTDDVVINVDELPTAADAGSDTTLCNLTTYTLAGNVPVIGSGNWSIVSGTATITTPGSATSTVTGLVAGTSVTLRWTISNDSCPASFDEMTIIINNLPTVANAGPDENLCNVTSTTMSANSAGVGTGTWTIVSGTATITSVNSPTTTVTGLLVGSVTLRWTISNGVCAPSSDDVAITVDDLPTTADADVDQTLCNVTSTVLSGNTPTVGTGTWTIASGTATITTPSSPTTTITGLVAGTSVTLRWTIANGFCPSSTDDVVITIDALPTPANAGPDQNICNTTSTVTAANMPIIGTGVWSLISGTATITSPSSPSTGITGLVIGDSVTLAWTITNGITCSASIDSVKIVVSEGPTAANAGPNQNLCNVTNTVLAGNTPTVGTGLWTVVSGIATITTPASPTSTVTGMTVGSIVTLRWTTSNGSCAPSTDDVVITIDQPPTVANAGVDTSLCDVTSYILAGNSPILGTGVWTVVSGSGSVSTPSSPTSTVTSLTIGSSTTLRWTISNGICPASTDDITITIIPAPSVSDAGADQNLCNTTTTTLSGNSPSVGTGMWSVVSGTAVVTTPTSLTSGVTGLTIGGTSVLRWTITNGICAPSTDDVTINVFELPTSANAGIDQIACNASTVTLAGNAPTVGTGIWTVISGTATITTPASPTSTVTGLVVGDTVFLRWTISNGTCPASSDDMMITIFNSIIANAGADDTICAGNTVSLSGSVIGATGGTWTTTGSGGFTDPNALATTYTPSPADTLAGTVTLILTSTGNGICTAAIDSMVVRFTPKPTVIAGPDQIVCAHNANVTLTGIVTIATGGTWTTTGTGTFANPNALNTVYTPSPADTVSGTVFLILTATGGGSCASANDTLKVDIDPGIYVNAGIDQSICINNAVVTLNGAVFGGTTTGRWTTSGSGTFNDSSLFNATYTPSLTDKGAGTVTLILTSTNNGSCDPVTDSLVITITPQPVVNAGTDKTICANAMVNLTGTVSGGTTKGIWSSTGTGTFANDTLLNTTYTPSIADTIAGNVKLILTSRNNGTCAPVSDTLNVTIIPAPAVNAGPNQTVCANNDAVFLNGIITGETNTGIWSTTGDGTFIPGATVLNTTYIPGATDISSGTVILILTSTGNTVCTPGKDTMVVTITPAPLVNAGIDIFTCSNNIVVTLNGSVTGGATTGKWTTTGTGTFAPNDSTLNATYTLSSADTLAGSVSIVLTSTNNGNCLAEKDTVQIIVTPKPTVNAGPDQTVCANSPLLLNGTVTGGAGTGKWTSTGTGTFAPDSTTLNATYTFSSADTAAGVVSLILSSTNALGCTIARDTMIVTISPSANVNAGPDQTICATTDTVLLNGIVGGITTVGIWTTSGTGTFIPNDTVLNAKYLPSNTDTTAGTVTLTLTSRNNGSCPAASDALVLTITPAPYVNAGPNVIVVCYGDSVKLSDTLKGGTVSIRWSTNGTGVFIPNDSALNVIYAPSIADTTAGTINIYIQSTNNGLCAAAYDTMQVIFTPRPNVNAGPDRTVCNDSLVALNGIVSGGTTTGRWTTSGTGTFSPNDTTLNASYVMSAADKIAGTFNLYLSSTNSCLVTDTAVINVAPGITVNAGPDQIVCINDDTVNLAGTVSGGSITGKWTASGSGNFIPNDSALNASYLFTSADSIAGSVTFILTSTNNGNCSAVKDTMLVTITTIPNVNAGIDFTFCANNAVIPLNGVINGGASTGIWTTTGTGTFSPNATTLNATYNTSAADASSGLVTLVLTSTNACVNTSDTVKFTITSAPVVNAGPNDTVCANNATITLNGSVSGPTTTGQWFTSGSGTFFPNTTTLNATYQPSMADTTAGQVSFYLFSTGNGNCFAERDTMVLYITPDPIVNAGPDQIVCNGNNVFLNGSVTGPTTTGIWGTNGTGTFTPGNTVLNATYIPSGNDTIVGTISFILTSTNNGTCNANTDIMNVTFRAKPIVNAGADRIVCGNNANVTLSGSVTGSSTTGIWSSSGTGTFTPNTTTLNTTYRPSSADTAAGIVTLVLTATNSCPITDTMRITITDAPKVNAGPDQTFCIPNPVILLNGSVTGGATTGKWTTTGTGTFSPNDSTLNATYFPTPADTLAGQITFRLTSTNNGTCRSVQDSMKVFFYGVPIVEAGPDQTVCANNYVRLFGNITGGITTGNWTTTGTGIFSPGANRLITNYYFSPADTVTGTLMFVLASPAFSSCPSVKDTMYVTITSAPIVNAGPDDTVCANNSAVSLNGSVQGGAFTGVWVTTGSGTFTPNNTTLNATYNPSSADTTAGSVRLILSASNLGNCLTEYDTMVVTITDAPNVNAGGNIFACVGDNVTLNGSVTGGATTGVWSTSGTGAFTPSTTTLNAIYTPSPADTLAGTVTLVLTSTNNNNCLAVTDTVTITITPKPVVNAGPDQTVCANNAIVSLNGSVTGATTTGIWTTTGTGTFSPNDTALNATYTASAADTASGQVILTLTSTFACAIRDSLILTITDGPSVMAGPDQIVCKGVDTVQLNGTVSGATTKGIWTTLGSGTFFPTDSTLNAKYAFGSADTIAGFVRLVLTSTNNGTCNATTDTVLIRITTIPVVNVGPDRSICANVSENLNGTITGGSGTGIWTTLGSGVFTPSATTLNAAYTFSATDTATGNVTLILTATASCINKADTVNITISNAPVVSATTSITPCGTSTTIPLNGTVINAGGVIWNTLGAGTFSPADTVLNPTYNLSPAEISSGRVTIILTSTQNGACNPATDTLQINITPRPIVNAGPDQHLCDGNPNILLTGTVTGGTTTGRWTSNGTGTFFINDTTLNVIYIASVADTTAGIVNFVLTSTNNGQCLAQSDTLVVIWSARPVVNAGPDQSVCRSSLPITLNGIITGGTATGRWTGNGTGTYSPSDSALNATYMPSAADIARGFVNFTLTSTNGCAVVSDVVRINIRPQPNANWNTSNTCNTLSVIFTNTSTVSTGSIVSWNWNFGDFTTSTLQSPVHAYSSAGTYTVSLIVTTNFGCIDTTTQTITLRDLTANFGFVVICQNREVFFTDSSLTGTDSIVSWQWDFDDGQQSILQNPSHIYSAIGSYYVRLIVTSASGCTDTIFKTVTLTAPPVASFTVSDLNPSMLENINFTDGSTDAATWSWNFGDGNTSTTQNPSHAYTTAGNFTIKLVVTSLYGCMDSVTMDLPVEPIYTPDVPTIFTPNGDGKNDIFFVRGGPIKTLDLKIYSEWGELLFQSTDPYKGWDGTKNGVQLPIGVYVYTFRAVTLDGKEHSKSGDVTLLR